MSPNPDPSPATGESNAAVDSVATRRRALAALGTAVSAFTAGCSGFVPDTGSESLSTEVVEDDARRIAWSFPVREDDRDGIGYVGLRRDRVSEDDSKLRLRFNTTVAELSTISSYNEYVLDRFEARFWVPPDYRLRHGRVSMLVEPPGQWDGFGTRYEYEAGRRKLVVEMRSIATKGTIIVPFVLDAGSEPLPSAVGCSFTVRASKPGWFGKTVSASDRGRLEFDA